MINFILQSAGFICSIKGVRIQSSYLVQINKGGPAVLCPEVHTKNRQHYPP
jgi:hypothetical protein